MFLEKQELLRKPKVSNMMFFEIDCKRLDKKILISNPAQQVIIISCVILTHNLMLM